MNVLGNATTYGIYIFRAFVQSRFLMGFWLSTFETDVSRGQLSLGKPPAIKHRVNLKARHAYQFNRRHRGRPRSLCDRQDQGRLRLARCEWRPTPSQLAELVLSELIRGAEDIDPGANIGL